MLPNDEKTYAIEVNNMKALEDESNRIETLKQQHKLLSERIERMEGGAV